MTDLDQPGGLTLADVGHGSSQHLQVWQCSLVGVAWAGDGDAQPAGARHLGVSAHRRRQESHTPVRGSRPDLAGHIHRHRGCVDDQGGDVLAVGEQPLRTGHDLLEVRRPGDHGDDDVPVGEVGGAADDPRPESAQRLRLGAGAVVDREVAALLEQARGQHRAHPADADPAEGLAIRRWGGHVLPRG